jgi:hypothetical protein
VLNAQKLDLVTLPVTHIENPRKYKHPEQLIVALINGTRSSYEAKNAIISPGVLAQQGTVV